MDDKLKVIAKSIFQMEESGSKDGYRALGPHLGGAFVTKRMYGGQIIGQAWKTVQLHLKSQRKDAKLGALYHTFIGPGITCLHDNVFFFLFFILGKIDDPIDYKIVESLGNVFVVSAHQNNQLIGLTRLRTEENLHEGDRLDLNYVKDEADYLTLDELAPLIPQEQLFQRKAAELMIKLFAFQVKFVEFHSRIEKKKRNLLYVRYRPELREFVTHSDAMQILLTVSDFFIFEVVSQLLTEHDLAMKTGASLNHHVTIHAVPDDPFDWFLFRTEVAHVGNSRCIIKGMIYDRQYKRLLTITQEGFCPFELKPARESKL
ncbi:hypothetical protein WR25_09928 isoform M [Diploscapter pachys]|uniref:Acyl-CoA thioesterase-like C-terminal domain-containing protein n=1 Tax=Diploscapter pachys TaxID=2018661 RepID=A0A2A2J1Y5_9BILA|nr:hypothetical protein WR25_09928 isoform E [Diploscapter pachys]PAV55579.1 hypothetical protein WR25_09928 isoform I [Diploscapter pachys]PAV55583.1 hypothetical protein WR25_09928 isoform M [Diploscapter pachys]